MSQAKINTRSCGLSVALVAALFQGFYSALALLRLIIEVYISGFYGYTDLKNYDWKPELSEFFMRLIVISLSAGAAAWLAASVYNFLNEATQPEFNKIGGFER